MTVLFGKFQFCSLFTVKISFNWLLSLFCLMCTSSIVMKQTDEWSIFIVIVKTYFPTVTKVLVKKNRGPDFKMRAGSGQTRALSVSGTAATMRFDWLARPRLSPSSQCHASSFRSRYRSICSFSPPFQRSRKHQPPTSLSHTAKPRLCACYHTKEALVHCEWQFFKFFCGSVWCWLLFNFFLWRGV